MDDNVSIKTPYTIMVENTREITELDTKIQLLFSQYGTELMDMSESTLRELWLLHIKMMVAVSKGIDNFPNLVVFYKTVGSYEENADKFNSIRNNLSERMTVTINYIDAIESVMTEKGYEVYNGYAG